MSTFEQSLLGLMLISIMMGLGSTIKVSDIYALKKMKREFFSGLCLQYLMMPLLAISLIKLFNLEPNIASALLFIACCPGGTTSNIFSYLAKANLPLSLLMTALTTLFAFVMVPLLWSFWGTSLAFTFVIPAKNIIMILFLLLVPTIIGVFIRVKSELWAQRMEFVTKILSSLSIFIMFIIWYPKIVNLFYEQDRMSFLAVGLMSFFGIMLSYLISKLSGLENKIAKTLSFETGIQNAPLAATVMGVSLGVGFDELLWVPLLYGALSLGSASFFLAIFSLQTKNKLKKSLKAAKI